MSVCDPTVGVVTIFPTPRRNRPVVFATMSPPRVTLLAALLAATIASTTLACTSDRNDANGAATTSGAAPRRVAAEPAGTGSCDAVDPTSCLLPWPNDRFTRADPSTATGRRVDLPVEGMPANLGGTRIDPKEWNRSDGFSPSSILLTHFDDLDVTASGLPPVTDIGQSITDDSPLALVDLDTGKRIPAWAELDANATDPARQLLMIVPATSLAEGHRHAVGITGLLRTDGTAVEATDEVAALVASREAAPWIEKLVDAGLDRDAIDTAWSFTVASDRSLSGRLRHMWDETLAEVGEGAPTFRVDTVTDGGSASVVAGSFDMPRYLTGDGGPGTVLNNDNDPDGLPTRNGTMQSQFLCTVPKAATPEAPAQMVGYGHGLLGSRDEVMDIGLLGANANIGFCALDWIGMSTADVPTVVGEFEDLTLFRTQPDRLQQGHLAFLLLGRLFRSQEGFASHAAFRSGDGRAIIDTTRASFLGASQGGILGGAPSALTADWDKVILAVGGTGYNLLLRRSVDFDDFGPILEASYPDELDQTLILDLIEQLWARGENDGYVQHLTDDPFDGASEKQVLLHEAYGDHQVTNVSTEKLARTIGVQLRAPSLADGRSSDETPQWGIEPIASYPHAGSGLIVWDFGTPTPPITNTPNRGGEDPHGKLGDIPEALALLLPFIDKGELVDPCAGAPCTSPG